MKLRTLLVLLLALLVIPALTSSCTTSRGGGGGGGGGGDDDDDDGSPDDDDGSPDDDDTVDWSDSDGDGIADLHEGAADFDGDGIPNQEDDDSDGDGIPDEVEAGDDDLGTPPVDSDFDGVPDFLDADSDNNGVPDSEEGAGDMDGDGIPDSSDLDNDGDVIPDALEIGPDVDNPVDTDGDGTPDYEDDDSDGDGISDEVEGWGDPDLDGIPNYQDDDSDDDGIPDSVEAGDDPDNPPDDDGDGLANYEDSDSDNDGLLDPEEATYYTDPANRDTDGDGYTDLAEVAAGTDPLDPTSVITGYYAELTPRVESMLEIPFTPEILQADVMFVLDTTGSMGGVLSTMASNFSSVITGVSIPNVAFGVSEFDDYAYSNYGDAGSPYYDLPFRLRQQITTNTSSVQSALSSLSTRSGGDWYESTVEAIFQAASGVGFDQDCDNTMDSSTDVPPFIPVASGPGQDAFAGNASGVYNSSLPGSIGGSGFRAGSVPIIVYTTDAPFRDPDRGDPVPPACSDPAGASDVASAVAAISGKLIGCGTNADPIPQMTDLANSTGSLADIGAGYPEPLVFQGTSGSTVTNVIAGIEALANSGEFDLTLEVDDEPYDFVTGINPLQYFDVSVGTTVSFQLLLYPGVPQTNSDQVFIFPLQVIGDGAAVLAEWELVLVVLAG
jgi:hypothetical protein